MNLNGWIGLVFGIIVDGTFAIVLYIIIKGYRELDKIEPEEINKMGVIKKR
jgi:NADH:ubiquinone oxidoreductase subunit K